MTEKELKKLVVDFFKKPPSSPKKDEYYKPFVGRRLKKSYLDDRAK